MPNIRLDLEYDGTDFHGWQIQPELRTIQGELHRVLETVLREKIHTVHASGRTDAGVFAKMQVVNFHVEQEPDLQRLRYSVSEMLKPELAVVAAHVVDDSFHARKSSLWKQYTYTILHRDVPPVLDYGRVWHITSKLDLDLLCREAELLVGTHDFSSFRGARCGANSPVKEILESQIEIELPFIWYRVKGRGFLKQMVRNIVGTLIGLAKGNLDSNSVLEILEARDRTAGGVTAPARGLCLDWVEYPE